VAHNQVNAGFTSPFAMEEELVSGDLIVLDYVPLLHRVPRAGRVTTVAFTPPPAAAVNPTANLHRHPGTRLMHFTYANFVMALDPVFGTTGTIFAPSTNKWKSYYGLDYDPHADSYYINYFQASPLPTGRFLARFDPMGRTLTTIAPLGAGSVNEVVTWSSRHLHGKNRPIWGQPYRMGLSIPSEANRGYLVGAAMGFQRGIQIAPGRRVHLDADSLFYLSLQAPSVFAGFQGVLDKAGRADPIINIPTLPNLQGFRFFLAAVTYDASGIRVITEPFGVTIE